ncbi:MAG: hypothetical protein ACK5LJ_03080 [Paracoccus sp. (in: a-proteobacteria)]
MSPEATVLCLNAVMLAIAYPGIYPSLREKTLSAMLRSDIALTLLQLLTVGALYYGSGIGFSLIFFDVNWFAFALITFMVMEAPLFLWFCNKHDIDLSGGRS